MSSIPKLLCVDDDTSTLDALERVLRKDFLVLRALSAEKAFDVLTQHKDVAIILSDYRMDSVNGVDFLNKAKDFYPLATRAILTGQMDLSDLMNAVNTQAIHRLILKPWDNNYLLVQMREALQTHLLLKQKQDLEMLSITDPVTGINNHRHFQEVLKRELERTQRHQRPLSLLMIDVDYFKSFNDRFGHPEGDRLLRKIADFAKEQLRNIDLLFRYGGEEFAVVMPDTNAQEAFLAAERLREAVAKTPLAPTPLTVSIGIASANEDLNTTTDLIEAADQALYRAKGQGRNKTLIQVKLNSRTADNS